MDKAIQFALVILIGIAGPSLAGAQAVESGGLAPVVRNSDGSVAQMDFDQATSYCRSDSMHVPSALEWANHAIEKGAIGISNTETPGYEPVWKMKDGSPRTVLFYFNSNGYIPGLDEGGNYWTAEPTWGSVVQMIFRSNSASADFWEFAIGNSKLKVRCAY